jgi:hypothetical protein
VSVTELEISVRRSEKDEYLVQLRYRATGGVDQVSPWGKAEFDFEALRKCLPNPQGNADYGKALFQQVFADSRVVSHFDSALVAAAAAEMPLRVRLFLDPPAAAQHDLRWS